MFWTKTTKTELHLNINKTDSKINTLKLKWYIEFGAFIDLLMLFKGNWMVFVYTEFKWHGINAIFCSLDYEKWILCMVVILMNSFHSLKCNIFLRLIWFYVKCFDGTDLLRNSKWMSRRKIARVKWAMCEWVSFVNRPIEHSMDFRIRISLFESYSMNNWASFKYWAKLLIRKIFFRWKMCTFILNIEYKFSFWLTTVSCDNVY